MEKLTRGDVFQILLKFVNMLMAGGRELKRMFKLCKLTNLLKAKTTFVSFSSGNLEKMIRKAKKCVTGEVYKVMGMRALSRTKGGHLIKQV